MTTAADTMELACPERADLADLLVTLEPAQWNAPSLCTQWRLRDVVAHVFSYDTLSTPDLVRQFLAARLNDDRVNALGVAAYAGHSTDGLLALVKERPQPCGPPAGFGGRIALTDGLIHHQGIRRALGLPVRLPSTGCDPRFSSPRRRRRSTPASASESSPSSRLIPTGEGEPDQ